MSLIWYVQFALCYKLFNYFLKHLNQILFTKTNVDTSHITYFMSIQMHLFDKTDGKQNTLEWKFPAALLLCLWVTNKAFQSVTQCCGFNVYLV